MSLYISVISISIAIHSMIIIFLKPAWFGKIGFIGTIIQAILIGGLIVIFLNRFIKSLSNSIVPPSNSPTASSHSFGEHNMGLEVQKSKISSPKLSPTEITSPNPNIKSNLNGGLPAGCNSTEARLII